METQNKKLIITAITSLAMAGSSIAATIFSGETTNTTIVHNANQGDGGILTGSAGSLVYTSPANSFNNSGFASTSDINTLLATNLLATDVITLSIIVESITGSEFRSNGLTLGLSSSADQAGSATSDALTLLLDHNNAGTITPSGLGLALNDPLTPATNFSDDLLRDGFELTVVANSSGYTFDLGGILTGAGTLTEAEFLGLGSSHFYYSSQQFSDIAMVTTFNEASISVVSLPVPEPSSTVLVGLGGLALILRRRK